MLWLTFGTNPVITTIAAFVCALGCYILTCSTEQFRLLALGQHVSKVLTSKGQFALMSLALGGVSLYAMNFLEVCSLLLFLPESESVGHEFDPHQASITFKVVPIGVSVLVACVMSFLGLYIASKDPMFAKTKKQIVDEFIAGAKGMSLKEVKAISAYKMFWVISTKKLGRLTLGGFITGLGALATSGLTMWSVAIADIQLEWNVGALVGAGVFSCIFSILSFWVLFRLLSLYPRKEILRIACVCVMAFGFTLTHYFTMDAITIRFAPGMAADDNRQTAQDGHLPQMEGFYIILVSVIVFCFVLLILTVVDLRSWLYESSNVVHKHECMLMRLKALHTDNFALIAKYMREVEIERSHHSSSGSRSPKKSLLGRSITSASDAVSVMSKHLPLGRGKVTPRAGGEDVIVSDCVTSSQVMPSPRPNYPSGVFSSAECLEASATDRETPASAVPPTSVEAALSLRLPDSCSNDIESGRTPPLTNL